jgi:hypothetical protein
MDVQVWLPVFARCNDPYSSHLMCTVYWQQHRLRRTFVRTTRANHHLPISNAPNKDHMPHRYALLFGEALDAVRQLVSMLQTYHENTAQPPFA